MTSIREIRGKFSEKIVRISNVLSFRFYLKEKIEFLPGQFLQVIFDENNRNNHELNKYLSFSCAPGKDYIEVTKKISKSQFSKKLNSLEKNSEVLFRMPLGVCVFKDEYKKIGFLVGGIGITPVISILEYISDKSLDIDVCLLYSNRSEKEIAFRSELNFWKTKGKSIEIVYTVSDCKPKDKDCFSGVINKEIITKHICDLENRVIFIFGSSAFVSAMKGICLETECNTKILRVESFVGY